jgi:hypothetical protein
VIGRLRYQGRYHVAVDAPENLQAVI